ncbi:MAG: hypothetical protein M3539_02885 [Acidobacteriota bacterium]|nr:hypothetical protein [Acidobacteriota bacterium]
MTRNQKIALGCGGAGCLGLIVIVIAVIVLSAAGYLALPGTSSNYNYNSNSNLNRNSNYNSNGNSNSDSPSTSSSMSEDDKHKLYQAVGMTRDAALTQRVVRKIGLGDGGSDDEKFVKDHFAWAMKNMDFIQSVNTPEKARAYVEEHIDD